MKMTNWSSTRSLLVCICLWMAHGTVARCLSSLNSPVCTVGGITWPHGTTRYLVGSRYLYGSVYAFCSNGTPTCFMDRGLADRFEHQRIPCEQLSAQKRRLALLVPNHANTWPKGVVCYEFSTKFPADHHKMMMDAMNEFKTRTERLEFVPFDQCKQRYGSDPAVCDGCTSRAQFRNDKAGCYASVGFNPSVQTVPLNVGDGCHTYGHYLHELGHLIGLGHEHCHPDRTVVVLRDRLLIDAMYYSKDYQRKKLTYDPTSIMHYRENSLCLPHDKYASVKFCDVNETAIAHKCIVPVESHCDPSKAKLFGYGNSLTELDIQAIRQLYSV